MNPEPFGCKFCKNPETLTLSVRGLGTDHGGVSAAEGQAGVGEGRRQAPQATVVYGRHGVQQVVHVGRPHCVAAQDVDGLLQAVVYFVLLRWRETQKSS